MLLRKFCLVSAATFAALGLGHVAAQELYKYVDKNGKVTYSDVKPKPGEKAAKVNVDHKDNVVPAYRPKGDGDGGSEGRPSADRNKEGKAEQAKKASAIESAEKKLADAKKALEEGREMTAEDAVTSVGRNEKGKPTGVNRVMPKPEYQERVTRLEEAVKTAEENLAKIKSENAGK